MQCGNERRWEGQGLRADWRHVVSQYTPSPLYSPSISTSVDNYNIN